MTTSMYSDAQGPSYTADMRILMENMQALNVNGRQDEPTLINTAALKEKEPRSMIPVRHGSRSSVSQYQTSETSDVCK